MEEFCGDPTLGPQPKVWPEIKDGRSRAKDGSSERLLAQFRKNPEGGELESAVNDYRRCKKNSLVLSCIDKRAKEGCNCGSEVG